jgi:murein DD-endopeptidase MepM/ murein hydrolase activator NlpD
MFSPRTWRLAAFVVALSALLTSLLACVRSQPGASSGEPSPVWTFGLPPTPTATSRPTDSYSVPATRLPGEPILTPTADASHFQPAAARGAQTYVVQPGDTLGAIALRFNVSVGALQQANHIQDPDSLSVGTSLAIPAITPQPAGPAFKILPDSELVYGPMSIRLDVQALIRSKRGYLATYIQDVGGETLNGNQIVLRVARDYSVNPALLLAVLEYRAAWLTNPDPDPALLDTPFGFNDGFHVGLYRQLVWAANALNMGFYRWRAGASTSWLLADGSFVPADPTINAGTAGVQFFFAQLDDYPTWLRDVSPGGFFDTFSVLFGYPFDLAIEPLVPANLVQPLMHLPFAAGQDWSFTGGPHGAWDEGSAWGALDFAPPLEAPGCVESNSWVTAVAGGVIVRTGIGEVIQDLDGDGYEQTGWDVLYMHVESRDRVQPGTYLLAGQRIGHPSCEGGVATGTHVHLARKFNGEWIPADGPVPFDLDGWISSGTGEEYVGALKRDGRTVAAYDGKVPSNQIRR